ncbi:gephyrin-like molybdotransferase Glp [Hydromonas duriensis]|uniref:Molybdopterin molybdenumtransferase n=1 Tax=Hydromonas duriensis TaxID=1527608 RepID=A0A4R6Y861_9BURK|nr:gephyrin-like molybdotransferase Glp [Hydromonas duriensis]TDR31532.1 molybdopterin molybdotransferase [Hydromonas duriensis]
MLDYQTALTQLLSTLELRRPSIQSTPLHQAQGRVLAHDIKAQYDSPVFDNSAMDGYALHLGHSHSNNTFELTGRIAAGDDASAHELLCGQAIRIFTGAPLPAGANAVVPQESAQVEHNQLKCEPQLGQHIRRRGEDIQAGDLLLAAGQILNPAAIGLAASQGYAELPVYAPLSVTVFSSGNELQEPHNNALAAGAIFDANRYQLLAWLHQLGCHVVDGEILPDQRDETEKRLHDAANNTDVILTSGGVSVGEEDHLKASLEAIGVLQQWKLLIKPGKPFAWGSIQTSTRMSTVMMLPGNPVATFVTFKMLVEPALRVLSGTSTHKAQPAHLKAQASFSLHKTEMRREFLRGVMRCDEHGVLHVEKLSNQGSHMLSACAVANALIEIPPNTTVNAGDVLTIYPL